MSALFSNPGDTTKNWKEWHLQAYIVQEARRDGWLIAGDMNQGKRGYMTASIAKACGLTAGEPDLRIYMPEGRMMFVELKTKKGKLSDEQKDHHKKMHELGHVVDVVYGETPLQAWLQVKHLKELKDCRVNI